MAQNEVDFDFYGKKEEAQRQNNIQEKKHRFQEFKKIAASIAGAVVLVGAVAGAHTYWEARQTEKINQTEKSIAQTGPEKIFNLIGLEKDATQKTYARNTALLSQYAGYKELVDLMNLSNSVNTKMKNNASLYKETLNSLDKDKTEIEKVVNATKTNDRNLKEDLLIESTELNKFNQWSNNIKTNQFMYVGGLIQLGKDTEKELSNLEQAKQEIIKTVQEKIKSKDYNLDATQNALTTQIASDAKSEVEELKKIRAEVKGTEQDNLLTDNDVNEAESAMGAIQNEAISKVAQDKATVESMIAKVASGQAPTLNNVPASPVQTNNASTVPTQTAQNSHQWGFFEYYLLYNWLSGGSANSPAVVAANTSSYRPAAVAPVSSSLHSSLSQKSANLYNLKDRNSYLNKSLTEPNPNIKTSSVAKNNGLAKFDAIKANKPDISAIRAKVEQARSKAVQASNVRQAELSKMRAAETARANSARSTSRSSFGGSSRGGGFGG